MGHDRCGADGHRLVLSRRLVAFLSLLASGLALHHGTRTFTSARRCIVRTTFAGLTGRACLGALYRLLLCLYGDLLALCGLVFAATATTATTTSPALAATGTTFLTALGLNALLFPFLVGVTIAVTIITFGTLIALAFATVLSLITW